MAKKILNKKIQVNTHIKFESDDSCSESEGDDEVQMLVDTNSISPVPLDDYQSSKSVSKIGGIKLDTARKKLRASDKLDRKRERERIKAIHQEKRRKGRQSGSRTETVTTLRDSLDDDSLDDGSSSSESETLPLAKRGKRRERLSEGGRQLGTEDQGGLSDDEELVLHLLKQ